MQISEKTANTCRPGNMDGLISELLQARTLYRYNVHAETIRP
jgi:hypothetical protein